MSGGSGDSTWEISTSGKATFNNIVANRSGSIGGWTIGEDYLQSGSLRLNSDGSITHKNWSITKDGVATFKNTFSLTNTFYFSGTGSLTSGGSLSGSGARIGAGTSFINPGTVKAGANTSQTLTGYFNTLYAKKADIEDLDVYKKLTYQGKRAYWTSVVRAINVKGATPSDSRKYLSVSKINALCTTEASGGGLIPLS